MFRKLMAYVALVVLLSASIAPAAFGAATMTRTAAARSAATAPKCAAGKVATKITKRVRKTIKVKKHGKIARKRVWVKKSHWVCIAKAVPAPAPIPIATPVPPVVAPLPAPAPTPDTTPPTAPPSFTATAGNHQVSLTWSASTDNVRIIYYQLFRDGVPIAAVDARDPRAFTDTNLVNGRPYTYTAAAHDGADNVSPLSTVTATPADTTPPSVPTALAATGGDAQVSLIWAASTDDVDVAGYNVYRSSGGGAYALITPAPVATPYFADAGLTNGIEYSYRLAAVDTSGNLSAQTTLVSATPILPADTQAPSVPSGLAATPGSSQVALSWSPSTDNIAVSGYRVYRSSGGGVYAQIAASVGASYTDTGLTNGTAYSYKVAALDTSLNASAQSAPVTSTPADTTAPSTPSGLAAVAGDAQVDLAWLPSTDNVAVTSYNVYRSSGGAFALVGSSDTPVFHDSGLTNGTSYSYKVAALDGSSNASAQSAAVSCTPVAPPDTQAPSVPGGLAATPASGQAALTWSPSTDNVAVTGYRVYRSAGGGAYTQVASTAVSSYLDTGLTNGTAYSYKVAAVDGAANSSAQSVAVSATPADTTAPSVPSALAATAADAQVALSWSASTDNVAVTGYDVYRSVGGGPAVLIGSTASTFYTDMLLTNGVAYSYTVAALDGSGNASAQSAAAAATPVASADTQAPTTPTGLSATAGTNQVALTWTGSTDNVAVTGYRVYRSVGGGAYTQVAAPAGTSYTDTGLTNGTAYSYKVAAVDAASNASAQSAAASATPADSQAPSTPVGLAAAGGDAQVALSWSASTDNVGVAGYRVYRSVAGGAYVLVASPASTLYTDTGLTNGTAYSYKVAAIDGAGNTSAQSGAIGATPVAPPDTQPPSVPAGLAATPASGQVALSWSPSTDNVGVVGYRVYRSVGGGAFTLIAAPVGTSYTDTGLTNGTAYSYKVAAVDLAALVSAQSSAVTATPADTTAPTVPAGLAATPGDAQVALSWSASTDNVAVSGYRVYRSVGGGAYVLVGSPVSAVYTDTALTNGTAYSYKVAAVDSSSNVSTQSSVVSATPVAPAPTDTQAPTVPSGLVATAGTNQVALSWSASTDNVGVTGYRVYRSSGGGAYTLIASPAGPSYTNTGLTNGTAYSYRVAAVDAAANASAQSAAVTGTPTDTTPPTVPTNVTLTKDGAAHTITIAWTASTDNVGVVKYRLVRNGILAAQPTVTSYVDKDLTNNATYSYTVAAVDAAGNVSAASPLVSTFVS